VRLPATDMEARLSRGGSADFVVSVGAGAVVQVVRPAGISGGVRVRATRGQTDMRGLVTAGRAVRLERPLV
jgi:hypothetical protein